MEGVDRGYIDTKSGAKEAFHFAETEEDAKRIVQEFKANGIYACYWDL